MLGAGEIRSRAASGAAILGARSGLIYAVGIGANLLLARLLAPRDFGIVTLGLVVLVVGTYIGEAGVGAALIRRDEAPSRAELEAVNGLQLAAVGTLALVCAAVAAPFGHDGLVIAAMVASLPISVLRTPSVIVLERQLRYRTIATADVIQGLSYYVWAVAAVTLGFGVWGLASAVVVRTVAGTATMLVAGPVGLLRPRWSWHDVRPLLEFGLKLQASQVLAIAREQGLNVAVAAIAGIATLGVWNLAWRVLQIPNLLFMAVGRVSYPAMSRLLGIGEDPRRVIERSLAALAVLTAAAIVAVVGFAQSLPAVVGDGWGDVPSTVLWSGVGLVLGAPILVGTVGYLLAADEPGLVARATLAGTVAWFGVTLPLLPSLGAVAVGIGLIANSIVSVAVLGRATASRSGAAVGASLAVPTAIALAAVGLAWNVAAASPTALVGGCLGVVVGELALLAGLAVLARHALRDTRALAMRGLQSLSPRRPASTAASSPSA